MKKNRFNFDKKILEMLDNLDLIPKTQTDPLPGVGGRLFIITKSQQNYFKQICDTLALVPEEEVNTYSKKRNYFGLGSGTMPKEFFLIALFMNESKHTIKSAE